MPELVLVEKLVLGIVQDEELVPRLVLDEKVVSALVLEQTRDEEQDQVQVDFQECMRVDGVPELNQE